MSIRSSAPVVLLFSGLLLTAPARAGVLSGADTVAAADPFVTYWATPPVTKEPNNDNVSYSHNFGGAYWSTFGADAVPMTRDVQFHVRNSGGVTEYEIWGDADHYEGNLWWVGYEIQLGFGTGAAFVRATLPGLDFDAPDFDSALNFDTTYLPADVLTPTRIHWSGQFRPNNTHMNGFDIDVPDLGSEVPASAADADGQGYWFTIRAIAYPAPEPASLALLGLPLAVLAGRRRRA